MFNFSHKGALIVFFLVKLNVALNIIVDLKEDYAFYRFCDNDGRCNYHKFNKSKMLSFNFLRINRMFFFTKVSFLKKRQHSFDS